MTPDRPGLASRHVRDRTRLTCIIPAYNEAESIQDTVRSVFGQFDPPEVVMVVDDGSSDDTGQLAAAAGATVVRSPGTGSKAGAQTFGLQFVTTPLVMVLDADSTLTPTSIGDLRQVHQDEPDVAAVCSYVVPRTRSTIWERGRYVEYLYAFGHGKQLQDLYGYPLISSGCCSMYRTGIVKAVGGWSERTLAEDMDLTWTLHRLGEKVRYQATAVCEPIEPDNARIMNTQLKRWSHGFLQNVAVHRHELVRIPLLRSVLAVAFWDGLMSALFYLIVLPILALVFGPIALIGYVIDAPAIAIPVLYAGWKRGEFLQALTSLPSFFILRLLNSYSMLRAFTQEVILNKPFNTYEKGH